MTFVDPDGRTTEDGEEVTVIFYYKNSDQSKFKDAAKTASSSNRAYNFIMTCKDYMEKYKKNLVGMKFFYNRNNIPDFDDKETDPFLASDKGLVDPLIGDFDITDPDLLNAEPLKVKLLSYEDFSDIYNEGDIYTAVPFSPEKRFLLFLVDYKYRCEERD